MNHFIKTYVLWNKPIHQGYGHFELLNVLTTLGHPLQTQYVFTISWLVFHNLHALSLKA
jgi:hypothetical protein